MECQSYCETAFAYAIVRLQEFVLIPGTLKFNFAYAADLPLKTVLTELKLRLLLHYHSERACQHNYFLLEVPASLQFQRIEVELHKTIGQEPS